MINTLYKLVSPLNIEHLLNDTITENRVIVRPTYLSICKADLRYFYGERDLNILKSRLPLTLIHEGVGQVVFDSTNTFKKNTKVVMLPNIPAKSDLDLQENYRKDSLFRSSKADGFMQELVAIHPNELVAYDCIDDKTACLSEIVTIAIHAIKSIVKLNDASRKLRVAIFGDGSIGYTVACVLKEYFANLELFVFGADDTKLNMFGFANKTVNILNSNEHYSFDIAFECVGGNKSSGAINQIIDDIRPQGTIVLLGVSEEKVAINTRMMLEKGLCLIGRSRSTKEDFIDCVDLLTKSSKFNKRISKLIQEVVYIKDIKDIYTAFESAKNAEYKVIMNWSI